MPKSYLIELQMIIGLTRQNRQLKPAMRRIATLHMLDRVSQSRAVLKRDASCADR